MSVDESFLARWARRKRAAVTNARDQQRPKDSIPEAAMAHLPAGEGQALVGPDSLPPIETLGAGSDIRPFLVDGVPADLTRAALRRAWSADPAIRDFIGLCENSWDFNVPSGVPGFGSLTTEDARRLLARVTEQTEDPGPGRPAAERPADDQASAPVGPCQNTSGPDQMELGAGTEQHQREEREPRRPLPRRRHGGALPD